MKARGQESAVLGTAALVHTELVVVPGPAAGRQEDVHQRTLHVLRVSPACKTNPNRGSDGGKGAGGLQPPSQSPAHPSELALPGSAPSLPWRVPTCSALQHSLLPPARGHPALAEGQVVPTIRGQFKDATGLEGCLQDLQYKALSLFEFF